MTNSPATVPPILAAWEDASGAYSLAVIPNGYGRTDARVLWHGGDEPMTGTAVLATDAERDALHIGATDDDATPYGDATDRARAYLVYGALDDYGIVADLAVMRPGWERPVIVRLDYI